jgi:thiol-disulfide isomerase/thioredoxin
MNWIAITLAASLLLGGAASFAQQPAAAAGPTFETVIKGDKAWWDALSPDERSRAGQVLMNEAYTSLSPRKEEKGDPVRALQALDALGKYIPQMRRREDFENMYLKQLEKADMKAAQQRADKLASDANPDVTDMVDNWRFVQTLPTTPVEFKYTDLDGKTIDLAQYRGKVVLLDFWATWCKPCMAEMPNIRAVYDKYREQGFEVIGITDDSPVTDPAKDQPNRFTVERLKRFMEKAGMNWPQLWDRSPEGEEGGKPLLKRFEVEVLPTTFLFGRDGRLITRDNKDEKLERNVRSALGLQAASH